ncbi:MAG: stage V sporulation protein AB [Clostridia bacterium]|nr:stage V sporulation protein AB [Clostridia bacterium]NCD02616.1 stage V sporulation protein AB [Clostridia bacterium]
MKTLVLIFIGLASGFTVASALFALIVTVGVLNRLARVTHSAKSMGWYESCFALGGIIGNVVYLYQIPFNVSGLFRIGFMGLFFGIYIGCFIGALAEVVNVFPIMFHRLRLRQGLKALIWSVALGKAAGGILHLIY